MLQDYRVYLTNVRNNLIQCGVDCPITPMETYRELFTAGIELDDILWYYSILAVSGSSDALKNYFLPLGGYYKEKMRQVFYKEFMEFVPDYRKISTTATLLGDDIDSPLDDSIGFYDDEEIDLFEDEDVGEEDKVEDTYDYSDEYEEEFKDRYGDESYANNGVFLDDESDDELSDEEEYCEHGIFIDEEPKEVTIEGPKPWEVQEQKDDLNDEEYSAHGVFLDELEDTDYVLDGDIDYSDELEGLGYESNDIEYDENGFEISDEEHVIEDEGDYDYEDEYPEEEIEYDENGFEISNEEHIIEDDEPVEDDIYDSYLEENGVEYDENGFEISDEEHIIEDDEYDDYVNDSIEYDENGFEISDEEHLIEDNAYDDAFEEESVEEVKPKQPTTRQAPPRDLSDTLQDVTNEILTMGKRFILKEVKKLKED